jgi:hypothetical protein
VRTRLCVFLALGLLTACLPEPNPSLGLTDAEAANPERAFFVKMMELCSRTVTGEVVSDQAADADWMGETLVVGPVDCTSDVIRMPLAVGRDASRTWVLSQTEDGLLFKHEHVEPDGSPSPVTQYGGLAQEGGTRLSQSFPTDAETRANFTENGIARSNPNVWTFTVDPAARTLTYTLARPATDEAEARDFRAEFDLSK